MYHKGAGIVNGFRRNIKRRIDMNYIEMIAVLLEKATEDELERLYYFVKAYIEARRKNREK